MNLFIWLVVGAVIGWIASRIMGTNSQQGLLLDIVVGIVGAVLAGWLLTPLFGISTINQNNFSIPALLVSLLGAVILLAIVRLLRRGGLRAH
ncbi:MAG: GlsB/YeaQ/YmgE family stress response membrane protein [Omnitrophica WOR_2 bacterium]